LFITACVFAIFANIGMWSFIIPQFDLLVHFQVQYLFIFALIAMVFAFQKKILMLTIVFLFSIPSISKVIPWYFGDVNKGFPSMHILCVNVKATNTNIGAIEKLVKDTDADFLVLLESMHHHQVGLENLEIDYPNTYSHSLETGSGFLLYSKIPISNTEAFVNGATGMVTIATTVRIENKDVDLVAVHPIRPGIRHGSRIRDKEMQNISAFLKTRSGDAVVIGDLNTTMWSRAYANFILTNGLFNLRKGRGILPSWRLDPFGPLFAIPIDHCFVRGGVEGASLNFHSLDGSDHDAILVGISIN